MSDEPTESDIRRRAAWLLGMLALVAALFVGLMVVFFNSSGGDGTQPVDNLAGPTSSSNTPSRSPGGGSGSGTPGTGSATSPGPASSTPASATPSSGKPSGSASCPTSATCALDTDIGDAVAAINAYRQKNGKQPVPGTVSAEAKKCALANGSGCSGGWAETQLGTADGAAAVQKILPFGKLLQDMSAIEVGWAYDPGAKQYYFAIIRQD